MKKRILALALVLTMSVFAGPVLVVSAVEQELPQTSEAELHLMLITSAEPSLRVSGTTANYDPGVLCTPDVYSINATLQIQQLNNGQWQNYGTAWTASSAKSYLAASGTKTVASGYTYRLRVEVTAFNGTTTGTVMRLTAWRQAQ